MKLNIYADFTDKIDLAQRLTLIKANGFDGVMLGFSDENKLTQYKTVQNLGLDIDNVHSPFDRMNSLWVKGEHSGYILNRTLECIDICAENGVKKVVVHPTDGLIAPPVTEFGLENFGTIINRAAQKGVDLLFENIQLPQFLDVIFDSFGSCENVRFCYDVGHENCFTYGQNNLIKHGARLSGLHIHDNNGKIDGHEIPFDGNIDYDVFLKRLKSLDYKGAMSLELYMSKSPLYSDSSCEEFVARAAKAGRKLIEMYEALGD